MGSENKNRPKNGWKQLNFKTIICLPTPKCAALFFLILFIFGVILSSIILSYSYKIIEKTGSFNQSPYDGIATSEIILEESITDSVYVFLEHMDYYQNHRIYLKSKSRYQLCGEYDTTLSTNCEPLQYDGDIDIHMKPYHDNATIILPCGLMPASFVTILIDVKNNQNHLTIDSSKISWEVDNSRKYQNQEDEYLNITDPHFKVWMRNSLTSTFGKIYGKINQPLEPGNLVFTARINSTNYLQYSPDMRVIISTTTRIGGKNMILGYTFVVVSGGSLLWAIIFSVLIKYKKNPTIKDLYQQKMKRTG